MIKVLHLADVHARRDRWAEVVASLEVVEQRAKDETVDLIAIAGDLFDGPVQDSERDILDPLCSRLQRLADIAPVALDEGTPTHDAPGSLKIFERLQAKHPIVILQPGVPYFLTDRGTIEAEEWSAENPVSEGKAKAILFGVPEPSKKWLLAEAGATGKDATDESVRAALRSLFLGLGGIRREHADLPCLLLYHGGVVGATSGTGYEVEGGIAVTRDDLAAVGADYIAMGHIHEPQQLPGLPAYYAGSAYPCTWGEGHQAGCNLVEIVGDGDPDMKSHEWSRIVSRIDFPHPRRTKYSTTAADPVPGDAEGLVWVEVTCTREEAAGMDQDELLARLLGHNALPGSRVTLNVLPTETVRAQEITERKALADKVRVWAAATETPVSETALARAAELEAEISRTAGGQEGACIRIDRLRLRGAIGIWKKSRKDEVDIDFQALGEGVAAFVGPNGHGKTTILENLTPWPSMLTRDGALKDHFRLKDSARELWFTDERTGWRYRAAINIRADIASGAAEYFLHVDKGAGYEPVPGIDGRKDAYVDAVEELFGSLELYLRTAFSTQRPTRLAPDLATATQGQRKALFVELSGIDYLERYREAAKARADVLDAEVPALRAAVDAASDLDEVETRAREILETAEAGAAVAAARMAEVEAAGKDLAIDLETARKRVGEREADVARKTELRTQVTEFEAAIAKDVAAINNYRAAAAGMDAAQAKINAIADVEAEAGLLRDQRDQHGASYTAALNAWGEASREAESRRGMVRIRVDTAQRLGFGIEKDIAGLEARIGAPIAETCPTCRQPLPAADLERLRQARAQLEGELAQAQVRAEEARRTKAAADADLEAITTPPEPQPQPFPGEDRLRELQGQLGAANPAGLRAIVMAAGEARAKLGTLETAVAEKQAAKARAEEQALGLDLAKDLLASAQGKLASVQAAYESKQTQYADARAEHATHRANRDSASARLQEVASKRAGVAEKKARLAEISGIVGDWRVIERAVGPNGIQALELDAVAPAIAAVSNKLLAEAYGSRYQIEFRTTRVAGKGSKTKQVEDFEIYILDTETGDEQTIDSLSGGERVWIMKALTDGFAIIRARNTGTRFQTAVLDESDGALDPEARMLYLRMLEAAHRESGRFQTLIVTQSSEIQAMVEKTIDIADLGPRPAEAKAGAA